MNRSDVWSLRESRGPTLRGFGSPGGLILLMALATSWCRSGSAQSSVTCVGAEQYADGNVATGRQRFRPWRLGRAPAEVPRLTQAPESISVAIDWDPLAMPDPTGVVELLAIELPAALANTDRFEVHSPLVPAVDGSSSSSIPGEPGHWLPAPNVPATPPQLECHVTVIKVSPAPPLELTATVELSCPLSTRPPLMMQGTWRPPEALRTVAPTRASRWRLTRNPVEDFQPEATLIAVSPREFARYAAQEMAVSLASQWQFADAVPTATGSGWSVPPESGTTP